MQKWVLKIAILGAVLLVFSPVLSQDANQYLKRADSLYNQRKFSEAKDIYQSLYRQGYSSPATLLKMAQAYEGLDQTSQALFFLTSYYYQSEDQRAYDKIQVIANAKNLSGYELSDFERLMIWLSNRADFILIALFTASTLSVIGMIYFRMKGSYSGKLATGILALFFASILFVIINFLMFPDKAVIIKPAYVMSGPSAGASFIELVSEGNSVTVESEKDIWVLAKWNGKEGYIRKSDLLIGRYN